MNRIVITGTGRCGTTFLIQLLTNLGYNTGYTPDEAQGELNKNPDLRGGIEHGLGSDRFSNSMIVKNPEFLKVDKFKKVGDVRHVIIPIRNLQATAESRGNQSGAYGGYCFGANSVETQKTANAKLFYHFIEYLTSEEIPFTIMNFPRIINDQIYCFNSLRPIFADLNFNGFSQKFLDLANPGWIRY